jgi:hypothetical protein
MEIDTAKKAAKWWADHLRNGAKLDNGDNSEAGAMTMMLGLLLQSKTAPAIDADAFEKSLVSVLLEDDSNYVGVDYHPDWVLSTAAERAGVNLSMASLPWKTSMWISGDKIAVAVGYGAEHTVLD